MIFNSIFNLVKSNTVAALTQVIIHTISVLRNPALTEEDKILSVVIESLPDGFVEKFGEKKLKRVLPLVVTLLKEMRAKAE